MLVPVWYRYTPSGEVVVQTGRNTKKARLLRAADAYLAATAQQLTDDIVVRMRPEHWRTANFAAFAAEFAEAGGVP